MKRLEIQDYIKPLLRWWWLLLISTMLAGLASYFYTVRQPQVYTSQSTLLVGSLEVISDPGTDDIFVPQELAGFYADMAMRDTVRQATMDALNMTWLPFYWVQALPNSAIIEISVTSEIPALSQSVANELGYQLQRLGPAGQEEVANLQFIEEQLAKTQNDIQDTEDEISLKQARLSDLLEARKIADAQSEIAALDDKLSSLQSFYFELLDRTGAESPNTISVLEMATLPLVPDPSNLWLNVLLASMVGISLASGGAYLLEYLDDTVKTSNDVKKLFDLPTLSAIPAMSDSKTTVLSGSVAINDSKMVVLTNPQSAAAESFRILRTNLQFADVNRKLKRIMLTSPEPGDGKSTVLANLGMALAQAGRRVIIVDADLHRPTQHQLFQVPNSMGITTALFSNIEHAGQLLRQTRIPGLRVLTSGPLPPNPSELLGSDRMNQLLTTLDKEADIILLDTPPATILIDAATLAAAVDSVVIVVRAGKSSRNSASQAVAALRQVHAPLTGVVLNGVSMNNSGYHYNYTSYGYNRYHRAAPTGRPVSRPANQNPSSASNPGRHNVSTNSSHSGHYGHLNGGARSPGPGIPNRSVMYNSQKATHNEYGNVPSHVGPGVTHQNGSGRSGSTTSK